MNVFILMIDEQSVSGEKVWQSVQMNSQAHRSLQALIFKFNGMSLNATEWA